MLTYEQARQQAQRLLDAWSGDWRRPPVITMDQEFDDCWVFYLAYPRRQESGSFPDMLIGAAPILIDRETGQYFGKGARGWEVEEGVAAERADRKRRLGEGWPVRLDARFLALLALIRDGHRDTSDIEGLISALHQPREGRTVLDELVELEKRGLVCRPPTAQRGTGFRWLLAGSAADVLALAILGP